MDVIDAQGTTFKFDGTEVNGILQYQFFNGVNREVLHRSLSGPANIALPSMPDYGQIALNLYLNNTDAGQLKLRDSLANRQVRECVLLFTDGSLATFWAFTLTLPVAGSKDSTNPINARASVLRISGTIVYT